MTGPADPDREPIAVLEDLWNIDKHRHPHFVLVFAKLVGCRAYVEDGAQLKTRLRDVRSPGPLKGKTKLARLEFLELHAKSTGVEVKHNVRFDIAFEHGPPTYGDLVMRLLRRCKEAVNDVVREFEPDFT